MRQGSEATAAEPEAVRASQEASILLEIVGTIASMDGNVEPKMILVFPRVRQGSEATAAEPEAVSASQGGDTYSFT